ncbi:hypothetical protein Anapl_03586 [Anas platyrhynchos]|uniref:Uncharacterized protein n=1 Tax=Anas platyrhynchos TaxID=8839 RepID=R0M444_ANAPL|nr:hypothetical protein Anapl_03586 [Anas platyrhynchos]
MAAALLHHDDTNPCETERWRHVNEEPTPPAQLQQSVSKPSTGLQKSETTPKPDAGSQAGCCFNARGHSHGFRHPPPGSQNRPGALGSFLPPNAPNPARCPRCLARSASAATKQQNSPQEAAKDGEGQPQRTAVGRQARVTGDLAVSQRLQKFRHRNLKASENIKLRMAVVLFPCATLLLSPRLRCLLRAPFPARTAPAWVQSEDPIPADFRAGDTYIAHAFPSSHMLGGLVEEEDPLCLLSPRGERIQCQDVQQEGNSHPELDAPQARPQRAQDLHREQLGLGDIAMHTPMRAMQRAGHPESAAAVPLVYFLLKRQGYRRFLAASNSHFNSKEATKARELCLQAQGARLRTGAQCAARNKPHLRFEQQYAQQQLCVAEWRVKSGSKQNPKRTHGQRASLLTATGGQPKTTHRFCEQKRFSKRALKSQTSIFTTGIGAAACWRSLLLRPHVASDAERAAGTQQQPCGQSLVQPRPLLLSYALVGDRCDAASNAGKERATALQEENTSSQHLSGPTPLSDPKCFPAMSYTGLETAPESRGALLLLELVGCRGCAPESLNTCTGLMKPGTYRSIYWSRVTQRRIKHFRQIVKRRCRVIRSNQKQSPAQSPRTASRTSTAREKSCSWKGLRGEHDAPIPRPTRITRNNNKWSIPSHRGSCWQRCVPRLGASSQPAREFQLQHETSLHGFESMAQGSVGTTALQSWPTQAGGLLEPPGHTAATWSAPRARAGEGPTDARCPYQAPAIRQGEVISHCTWLWVGASDIRGQIRVRSFSPNRQDTSEMRDGEKHGPSHGQQPWAPLRDATELPRFGEQTPKQAMESPRCKLPSFCSLLRKTQLAQSAAGCRRRWQLSEQMGKAFVASMSLNALNRVQRALLQVTCGHLGDSDVLVCPEGRGGNTKPESGLCLLQALLLPQERAGDKERRSAGRDGSNAERCDALADTPGLLHCPYQQPRVQETYEGLTQMMPQIALHGQCPDGMSMTGEKIWGNYQKIHNFTHLWNKPLIKQGICPNKGTLLQGRAAAAPSPAPMNGGHGLATWPPRGTGAGPSHSQRGSIRSSDSPYSTWLKAQKGIFEAFLLE